MRELPFSASMSTVVDQLGAGPGQAGLPAPSSGRGRPLTGLASQSYNVVSLATFGVGMVIRWRRARKQSCERLLQASAWEQTAVLSTSQEQSIELLAAACSQRPVPRHVGSAGVPFVNYHHKTAVCHML